MAIKRAQVKILPTLACRGYIESIEDAKATESGDYVMIKMQIKGINGCRGSRLNLLFRPEWFKDGFDPEPLKKYTPPGKKEGSMYAVYRMHVGGTNSAPSYLEALCGSEEGWIELQAKIDALANGGDIEPEAVGAVIKEHLLGLANEGTTFGYVLSQERKKTDAQDENGRTIYESTDNYEISDGPSRPALVFFTDAQDKAWRRRSASSAKAEAKVPFLIAYESV